MLSPKFSRCCSVLGVGVVLCSLSPVYITNIYDYWGFVYREYIQITYRVYIEYIRYLYIQISIFNLYLSYTIEIDLGYIRNGY